MTLTLIWKPEGEEPELSEFRMLGVSGGEPRPQVHFATMNQLLNHLSEHIWPDGLKPWAHTPKGVLNPFELKDYTPE